MQPLVYIAIALIIFMVVIIIRQIIRFRKPKILRSPMYGIPVDIHEVPQGTASLTLIDPAKWLDDICTHYPKVENDGHRKTIGNNPKGKVYGVNRHWSNIISLQNLENKAIVHYVQIDNYTELHGIREVYAERYQEVIDFWTINGNIATLRRLHYHYDDVQGDVIPGLSIGGPWKGKRRKITKVEMFFNSVWFFFGNEVVRLNFPKEKVD